MTHFRLDVTITSITSITSGFWPDVTLDGSLPGGHPTRGAGLLAELRNNRLWPRGCVLEPGQTPRPSSITLSGAESHSATGLAEDGVLRRSTE